MRTRAKVFVVAVAAMLCTTDLYVQENDGAVWQAFLNWAEAVPAETFVGNGKQPALVNVLELYRAHLSKDGVPAVQIDDIVATVRRRTAHFGATEWQRLSYNKSYAAGVVKVYTEKPNALVAEVARSRAPGTALDVAMGQGRNAIYLAQQGWRVTGFDVAEQGLAVATDAARKLGLSVNFVKAANSDFDWGASRWDLIVINYAPHAGPIEQALAPGGLLVLETFLWDPLEKTGSRPAGAIGPNDLLTTYPTLRVLRYEDTMATADWGGQQSRLVRFVARKEK